MLIINIYITIGRWRMFLKNKSSTLLGEKKERFMLMYETTQKLPLSLQRPE